mmetsp:Transcript_13292/g.53311  ORF Transcript_13292/g.53311 Transcript_13292/m.53311 type:complete len:231 (-) Transcript_13292:57-749(-)
MEDSQISRRISYLSTTLTSMTSSPRSLRGGRRRRPDRSRSSFSRGGAAAALGLTTYSRIQAIVAVGMTSKPGRSSSTKASVARAELPKRYWIRKAEIGAHAISVTSPTPGAPKLATPTRSIATHSKSLTDGSSAAPPASSRSRSSSSLRVPWATTLRGRAVATTEVPSVILCDGPTEKPTTTGTTAKTVTSVSMRIIISESDFSLFSTSRKRGGPSSRRTLRKKPPASRS